MKAYWRRLASRIDALSHRERVIVLIALVLVLGLMIDTLFIDAPQRRTKVLRAQIAQQQGELPALRQQVAALQDAKDHPDAAAHAQEAALRAQITEANSVIAGMQENLVPAAEMSRVLEDLLARSPRVHIVALKTLPAATLVDPPQATGAATAAPAAGSAQAAAPPAGTSDNIYKHGVELTLEGSYADLHDYLTRAERMPWRMFWSRAVLDSSDYPHVRLTVTVYTLSLDPAWLQV